MDGKIVGKCSLLMKKLIVLLVMTAGMVSCSKEENEQTYQEELEPLRIGCISFSDKKVNRAYKNGQSIANAVPGELLRYKDEAYISSDSSISFTGCLPWMNPKEEHKDNIETASLRSSDNNLKFKGIGIFRLSGKGYSAAQNNIHYAYNYDENDWSPSDKRNPVYLGKAEATLCAYYPYNTASTNGNITLTSQLYSDDADICYQTGKTASSESGDVSFTLNHAYAKITFIFKREESYRGNGAVSKISISGENILSSNTLAIKTGSYGSGTSGAVTVNPGITFIESGGTASTEVLIIPVAELTDKVIFTFTIDGSESVGVFSPSVDEFNKFEAGKNYKIKINLKSNIVIVTGETANCYMLAPGTTMQIPVNVKGNGDANAVAGTGLNVHHTAKSVGILWETSPDLISLNGFTTANQKTEITANDATQTGNAVIAVYSGADQTGDILWSWHIWVSDYDPEKGGETYTVVNSVNASYVFMDRNLGAVSAMPGDEGAIGLLYQWGRKDPFTAASILNPQIDPNIANEITVYNSNGTGFKLNDKKLTVSVSNNLLNSIKNPDILYVGTSSSSYDWYTASDSFHNNYLWGGASTVAPDGKTVFDPCPAGWRVPAQNGDSSPWSGFSKSTFALSDYGRVYAGSYYPSTGCRYGHDGELYSTGASGSYWSANTGPDYGYRFLFDKSEVYPLYNSDRAGGLSVRCVKE